MASSAPLLAGKKGLILGVANGRSLAWGIAESAARHGAELAFTCQNEMLETRVRPLAAAVGSGLVMPCDVNEPDSLDAVFATIDQEWGTLDFAVHAVAFSRKEELKGRYIETTPGNFDVTLRTSCYSFTAVSQRAERRMQKGGSLLTLSYYGAEKYMPHYNVMGIAKAALEASVRYLAMDLGGRGIRVNAISAGPIRTLASSAIGDFRYIRRWNELNSPLRRNVGIQDVGDAAVYLLSDLSRAVTGEIHHVDAGYNIQGMKRADAPDIAVVGPGD
jgi:enoyl-[acyl-carrier protein] reductase I